MHACVVCRVRCWAWRKASWLTLQPPFSLFFFFFPFFFLYFFLIEYVKKEFLCCFSFLLKNINLKHLDIPYNVVKNGKFCLMDTNNILVPEFQNVLRIPEYNFNEVQ